MFGLGLWEILFILLIALVVLGPEKLPGAARQLGRFMGTLRKSLDEIKREVTMPNLDLKAELLSTLDLENIPEDELTCEQREELERRRSTRHPEERADELATENTEEKE